MELTQKIEGVLFYKAAPVKKNYLQKLFGVTSQELESALNDMAKTHATTSLQVVHTETDVQLVTKPELDELIESIRKDDLKRDIGKAGAETLAIVLYKGPITRVQIDRIRGVNSAFILRNLMVRGLVERNTEGKYHSFSVTPMLLNHLGVDHKTNLPNYATVLDQLERFEETSGSET